MYFMNNDQDSFGLILPISSKQITEIKGGDSQTFSRPGVFASGFGDNVDIESESGFVKVTSSSFDSNSGSESYSKSSSSSHSSINFSDF